VDFAGKNVDLADLTLIMSTITDWSVRNVGKKRATTGLKAAVGMEPWRMGVVSSCEFVQVYFCVNFITTSLRPSPGNHG
jgi:hypothetical protein